MTTDDDLRKLAGDARVDGGKIAELPREALDTRSISRDLVALAAAVVRLLDERDRHRAALRGLVDAWTAAQRHIDGAITIATVHGFTYEGPSLGPALAAAKAALGEEKP